MGGAASKMLHLLPIAGCEAGGRDHETRNARNVALDAGKGRRIDSTLELPEREWSCQHLDFHPRQLILDLWSPDVRQLMCVIESHQGCGALFQKPQ